MVAREYNPSLDEMQALAIDHISRSVRNKRKAMHAPALSIQGESVAPRTVILRAFDEVDRQCVFHTDFRSQKIASLQQSKIAFLHAYDRRSQLQLRMMGEISLEYDNSLTRSWWQRLSPYGRNIYCTSLKPGSMMDEPVSSQTDNQKSDDDLGYQHFSVLRFTIIQLECLLLGRGRQYRSLHEWTDNELLQHWLVP